MEGEQPAKEMALGIEDIPRDGSFRLTTLYLCATFVAKSNGRIGEKIKWPVQCV